MMPANEISTTPLRVHAVEPRERPILFSAPMVRALLAGTKTQTRRVVALPRSRESFVLEDHGDGWWPYQSDDGESSVCSDGMEHPYASPYGLPGDRLYVREAWRTTGDGGRCDAMPPRDLQPQAVWYEADGIAPVGECVGKVRRAFHQPRWASRILLEVTGVRVERLQDISEADARAEGASFHDGCGVGHSGWRHDHGDVHADARSAYARLWEKINGVGSWGANRWVWVVKFRRVAP